jgi:hypothetical protein
MKFSFEKITEATVPKQRQKHYSYNESLNEPASLIAYEPADVEQETPAEENAPIEEVGQNDPATPSASEE